MKKFVITEFDEGQFRNFLKETLVSIFTELELSKGTPQPNVSHEENLLTRREACDFLKLSYPTISRLTKEGLLSAKRFGNSFRYKQSDLENFNSKNRKNSAPWKQINF